MISVTRYHDFSAGHRVTNHEGKCKNLHGHNYRLHFTCVSEKGLDDVGRVIDFSEIKKRLCTWIERNWDHRFLIWMEDPLKSKLVELDNTVVWTDFNPTAENMAEYFVEVLGPQLLAGTGVSLFCCQVDETRKCSATYTKI